MKTKCKKCGNSIRTDVKFCPSCGGRVINPVMLLFKTSGITILLILAISILVIGISLINKSSSRIVANNTSTENVKGLTPSKIDKNFIIDLQEGTVNRVKIGPSMTPAKVVRLMGKRPEEVRKDIKGLLFYFYYGEGVEFCFNEEKSHECFSINIYLNNRVGGPWSIKPLNSFKGSLTPIILGNDSAQKVIETLGEPSKTELDNSGVIDHLAYITSYGYFWVNFDEKGRISYIWLCYEPDPNNWYMKYLRNKEMNSVNKAEYIVPKTPSIPVHPRQGLTMPQGGPYNKIRMRIEQGRTDYVNQHPELPEDIKQTILNGTIYIEMLTEWVLASWGRPDNVVKNVNADGAVEQWEYTYYDPQCRYSGVARTYVYIARPKGLQNGWVTSWQETGDASPY